MPTPPEEQEQELSPYPLATDHRWESLKHASAPTIGITQQKNTNDKNDDLISTYSGMRHSAFDGLSCSFSSLSSFSSARSVRFTVASVAVEAERGYSTRRRGAYRRAANDEEWERGVEDGARIEPFVDGNREVPDTTPQTAHRCRLAR